MLKASVEADTISYYTVLKAFVEARDVARAEHRLSTMLKAGAEINTIRYSTATKACADHATWSEPSVGCPFC